MQSIDAQVGVRGGTLIARALIGPFTKAAGAEYVCELPVSLVDGNA